MLKAYSIAIGALDIVVEVTIQAEPLAYLKHTTTLVEGANNITELHELVAEFGGKYEQVNIVGSTLKWDDSKHELMLNPDITLVYWEETDHKGVRNCSLDFCSNDCGRCDRNYHCYDYKMEAIATTPIWYFLPRLHGPIRTLLPEGEPGRNWVGLFNLRPGLVRAHEALHR